MKMRVFDPRVFISPPFTECPKCHKAEFGVLMVNGAGYVKRCRACWHDAQFDLPELTKKIIYLDQFVVSNMMKSINPASRAFTDERVKPYRRMYEKLDRLSKLQLVVCPYSKNHRYESMASGSYEALQRVYHQLSYGLSFALPEEIRQRQIYRSAKIWLGENGSLINFSDALSARVHDWQGRLLITADIPFDQATADEITAYRDTVAADVNACFQRWQQEQGTRFADFYQRELNVFGTSILQRHVRDLQGFQLALEQGQEPRLVPALSSDYHLIRVVMDVLRDAGTPGNQIVRKMAEFFCSDAIKQVPCVQIQAMLYASLAQEAIAGRTKPPTQGEANDVEVVASYAPYCDAIFVDRGCHSLLSKVPTKSAAGKAKAELGLEDKVYSPINIAAFTRFLDEIEKSATAEHLLLVEQVYGPDWAEAYTTIFSQETK